MRSLKVIYIIALIISAIDLLQFVFGVNGIFYILKDVLLFPVQEPQKFSISAHYTADNNYIKFFKLLTKVNTTGYFLSLIGTCSSLMFYKLDRKTKYIVGICFFAASLIFSVITGPIWTNLIRINLLYSN